MTHNEFLSECGERLIDVSLAVENDKIVKALAERDDNLVRELLDSEF